MTTAVRHDPDQHQYSLVEDDTVIGFAAYEDEGDVRRFVHTEVDPEHRGGGHASMLVQAALDDVRADDAVHGIVPQCTYVAAWVERHPDYQELVAE
jgi:uncharacterized protein